MENLTVSRDNRTICVTAKGSVSTRADKANVQIGFMAFGPDNDSVYADGIRISDSIMKALEGVGVAEDAIRSLTQGVTPTLPQQTFDMTDAEKVKHRIVMRQSWSVRCEPAEAGRILDAAVRAGANQSGAINWSLADNETPQIEAATRAMRQARAMAEALALSSGAKLGALIYVANAPNSNFSNFIGSGTMQAGLGSEPRTLAVHSRSIDTVVVLNAYFAID